VGHDPSNLGQATTVVISSAVREDNPELMEARARGLQVLHRSEALRWIMRGKRVLAVAGSHGKTTSTAMLATALDRSGRPIGAVNGGVVSEWGVSSRWGSDDLFVIEADESDRSFVGYSPAVVMITVFGGTIGGWGWNVGQVGISAPPARFKIVRRIHYRI